MLSLLGSLTKNGWRETFRMLRDPEYDILKQPSPPPRKKYVHIRQRDAKGRKMRAEAFQVVGKKKGVDAATTYRRVDDGDVSDEGGVKVLVLEKKTAESEDEVRGRRVRPREKNERKDGKRVKGREVKPSRPANEEHAGSRRRRRSPPLLSSKTQSQPSRAPRYPTIRERSSVGISRSRTRRESQDTAVHQDKPPPPGTANEDDGARSPFSQPDMSKQDSHAFVFGDAAVSMPSPRHTGLHDRGSGLTDPFVQMKERGGSDGGLGDGVARSTQPVEYSFGASTGFAEQGVAASPALRRDSRRGVRGRTDWRRNSTRGVTLGKQMQGMEVTA